jgi:phosphoglycerol transferase MdoB-like AlkP superfamily enzyme
MDSKEKIIKDKKSVFFNKILLKPFILVVTFSLWPLIIYALPWFPFPILVGLSFQIVLVFSYLSLFVKFIKFRKFPTFIQAKNYYSDLKKVKKIEIKAKKSEKQKFLIGKNKKRSDAEEARMNKLQNDLEERKRKVL